MSSIDEVVRLQKQVSMLNDVARTADMSLAAAAGEQVSMLNDVMRTADMSLAAAAGEQVSMLNDVMRIAGAAFADIVRQRQGTTRGRASRDRPLDDRRPRPYTDPADETSTAAVAEPGLVVTAVEAGAVALVAACVLYVAAHARLHVLLAQSLSATASDVVFVLRFYRALGDQYDAVRALIEIVELVLAFKGAQAIRGSRRDRSQDSD